MDEMSFKDSVAENYAIVFVEEYATAICKKLDENFNEENITSFEDYISKLDVNNRKNCTFLTGLAMHEEGIKTCQIANAVNMDEDKILKL